MFISRREERAKQRRRHFFFGAIFALGVLVPATGIAVLRFSPLFRIEHIVLAIGGEAPPDTERIESSVRQEVAKTARGWFWGIDNSLAWPATVSIRSPILQTFEIEHARSRRTLSLRGEKAVPLGIWCAESETLSRCAWFDEKGILIREAPNTEGILVLKVIGIGERTVSVGDAALDANGMHNLLVMRDFLANQNDSAETILLTPERRELTFQTRTTRLIISTAFLLAPKTISFLDELYASGKIKKAKYVDMTVEGRVYVK